MKSLFQSDSWADPEVGSRAFLSVYLASLFFIGVGYLGILPPWEGFDEGAHYSSLRQISDTRSIPVYGRSLLDEQVENYSGPIRYDSGNPPFDRGMVYPRFFADQKRVDEFRRRYREQPHAFSYRPGNVLNWQAQHPPLYYMVLAPLLHAVEPYSFTTQIFVLRVASYVLALAGVWLCILAIRRKYARQQGVVLFGFLLYPIMLPMFFPEFARIGNDSLCVFLVGVTAYLLSRFLRGEGNIDRTSLAIGVVLGLGLLTKALFLPIVAGLAAFLVVRWWFAKDRDTDPGYGVMHLLKVFVPALLIGGGWYFYKLVAYGDLTGSSEAIQLARQGGLIAGLKENFSVSAMLRGVVVPFVSYSWAGTWSLVRLPAALQLPLLAFLAWTAGAYLWRLRRKAISDAAWLPVWVTGFFVGGLMWHVVVSLALMGNGATPGWYMHVLMPWIAPALGIGAVTIITRKRLGLIVGALVLYGFLFQAIAIWSQLSLFAGCATKGHDKLYVFSGDVFCLDQAVLVWKRISILGYPELSVIVFAIGFTGLFWLLAQAWRQRRVHSSHIVGAGINE